MSRKDKFKENGHLENGFTLIESLWSLMLVLSLMCVLTIKIVEFKHEQNDVLLRDYLALECVKICEIFYNEKVDFMEDIKKFYNVIDNKIIIKYDEEIVKIDMDYSENIVYDLRIYTLILNFPEEIVNMSTYLFKNREFHRWEYA